MKIIDLSHTVSPGMPVYPGTEPPRFTDACTIDTIGFAEKEMTMYSHTGTHMDAPSHIIEGAKTLDQLPPDHFVGKSSLVDVTSNKHPSIDCDFLKSHEHLIESSEFLLLHTGWSKLWGKDTYFQGYPVLSSKAATWLTGFQLKGIGMDTISADEAESTTFPIHTILLDRNIVIIENLRNLQALPAHGFMLCCFPLKIEYADGSPVRAVALVL